MSCTDSARNLALGYLDHFRNRILPGVLRRIAAWKGIRPQLLRDWQADIHQELALDCLRHAITIAKMPERERHTRWMRLTERIIYRQRKQIATLQLSTEVPELPAKQPPIEEHLQIPPLVILNNGRANVIGSIRKSGIARRKLRNQLDLLAAKLGWDTEQQEFWQSRVVEALTGLAADQLRIGGSLRMLSPPRESPNTKQRVARLRSLSGKFPVQPSTRQVRSTLRPWTRTGNRTATPRTLLEQAVALQPESTSTWLWLFEACCEQRDAQAAMRALRTARRNQAAAKAVVLGRARLLELRGRFEAGIALLQRAACRWPREVVYLEAIKMAQAAA